MRNLRFTALFLLAFGVLALAAPAPAQVAVGISVHIGPPALPVYVQPVCPGPRYIWTPGYWAYGDDDYYWVPGTWVMAPRPGFLWTPGYWGWAGGVYMWHGGYWGPHVGFYGGINYGFGYGGVGFAGGEWRGGEFFYNRSVANVNVTVIHNTYNRTVVVNNVHTSFNGGEHGVNARPTADEERYSHEEHMEPTHEQLQNREAASKDPSFRASANHGHPAVAATAHPGNFHGEGVVGSRGAEHASHAEAASARNGSEHSNANRPENANRSGENHANNPHAENKSHAENNKPHAESKPRQESKPHADSKPHAESKPKPQAEKHPHR